MYGKQREGKPHITSQGLLMQADSIHSEEIQRLIDVVSSGVGCGWIMVNILQLYVSCVW